MEFLFSFPQHYFKAILERRWLHQQAFGLRALGMFPSAKTAVMDSY